MKRILLALIITALFVPALIAEEKADKTDLGAPVREHSLYAKKEYDGVWFLGINMAKDMMSELKVRQAIIHALDREYIVKYIVREKIVPAGYIPPGMLGYDPSFRPYKHNPKFAKLLMKRAGYPINDPRIKSISLLHTDGKVTKAIAKSIQDDLKFIGIKLNMVEIPYKEQERWQRELASGRHHLFLMGYKANIEDLFREVEDIKPKTMDGYDLLNPLYHTNGTANFTFYSNPEVDNMLDQLSTIEHSLITHREPRLRRINLMLYKDIPAINLFFIPKL